MNYLFPGARGNLTGDILIVGEAFGSEENKEGKAFVGSAGKELEKMLVEAGVDLDCCAFTTVINRQPPLNDFTKFLYLNEQAKQEKMTAYKGVFPTPELYTGLKQMRALIAHMEPKLIIATGNWPLWALTDNVVSINNSKEPPGFKVPAGIATWRGSQLYTVDGIPLLPTYHPANVLRNWASRVVTVNDYRMRVPLALANNWDEPERFFTIAPDCDTVLSVLTNLLVRLNTARRPVFVAVDIETRAKMMSCIGIAWSTRNAICIPFFRLGTINQSYWTQAEEIQITQLLKQVLEHPNIQIIGQNFIYDYQYLWAQHFIKPKYEHDTMLAHHTCFPGTPMGLDYLSAQYCDWHRYWKDDNKEAIKNSTDEQSWEYNCRDCVITFEVFEVLEKVIHHYGLVEQYALQMQRAKSAINLTLRGVRIDKRAREAEYKKLMNVMEEFDKFFARVMPTSVYIQPPKLSPWWRSDKQLRDIFYDILRFKPILDHKTKRPTVGDAALTRLALIEPAIGPIIRKLQQYNSMETFTKFCKASNDADGRMRSSFSPTTETFRYRSSANALGTGANMQNIPKGAEDE